MPAENTAPMSLQDRLPALQEWLHRHVAGFEGTLRAEAFEGGQSNPTYRLITGAGEYVLRRKPMGKLLPGAHAVDREFRVLRALAGTAVPVATPRAFCDDNAVIGSSFYVMDYVPGRIIFDPTLPGVPAAERHLMFDAMNEVIANLHGLDWRAAGLEGFGRAGGFLARQIARWTQQYRAATIDPIPAMDRLIAWLPAHLPAADEVSLVHGDYRIDNLMFHPTEPRIVAVLDWELSTIGDPLADFGYHAICWRIAPELFRGLAGIDVAALGIPTEAEYLNAYCRRTGRDSVEQWEFYLVYGMFRLAAIMHGILQRAVNGSAAGADAFDVGRRGARMAEAAWELAQSLDAA
jgi:aminoglycoside phosphotransferase (APT) family kinase protein